jgi:hypothetical protein
MTCTLGRLAAVVIAFSLGGCGPGPEAPPPKAPTALIDYAGWPQLTLKPIPVARRSWALCSGPDQDDPTMKKLGPHAAPAIRIYANPVAHAHLRDSRPGALPVGSILVKEKLDLTGINNPIAEDQVFAYAAMIKREAGYDLGNGDWEYLYDATRTGGKVERGKLTSCIECHRQAEATDYLFRKYDK